VTIRERLQNHPPKWQLQSEYLRNSAWPKKSKTISFKEWVRAKMSGGWCWPTALVVSVGGIC